MLAEVSMCFVHSYFIISSVCCLLLLLFVIKKLDPTEVNGRNEAVWDHQVAAQIEGGRGTQEEGQNQWEENGILEGKSSQSLGPVLGLRRHCGVGRVRGRFTGVQTKKGRMPQRDQGPRPERALGGLSAFKK